MVEERADIGKLAKKATHWIEKHRDFFSIPSSCDLWGHPGQRKRLKRFTESVMCADVLLRSNFEVEFARRHLEWAWKQLKDGHSLKLGIVAEPSEIYLYQLYACLERNGFETDKLREWIDYSVGVRFGHTNPTWPWHLLGAYNAYLRSGQLCNFPEEVLDPCWLFGDARPWDFSIDIGYALAHEIFYLSDFGFRDLKDFQEIAEKCQMWLPVWCIITMENKNWDLLAELLVCYYCIFGRTEFVYCEDSFFSFAMSGNLLEDPISSSSKYHTLLIALILIAKKSESDRGLITR